MLLIRRLSRVKNVFVGEANPLDYGWGTTLVIPKLRLSYSGPPGSSASGVAVITNLDGAWVGACACAVPGAPAANQTISF